MLSAEFNSSLLDRARLPPPPGNTGGTRACIKGGKVDARFAYNCCVDGPLKPTPPGQPVAQGDSSNADRRRALRAEAMGLIVIAVAILIYAILRYGSHINWSAR